MIQVVATRKLLQILVQLEVGEADVAARKAHVRVHLFVVDGANLLELLKAEPSLYQKQPILVQSLDHINTSLVLFLDVCLGVVIEVVVHLRNVDSNVLKEGIYFLSKLIAFLRI